MVDKRKSETLTLSNESLRCPTCYEIPKKPPIYSCSRGHIICSMCKFRTTICPLCNCPNMGNRNSFAERLISAVRDIEWPEECQNASRGCNVTDQPSALEEHENKCVYRLVNCPARYRGACRWNGPLSELLPHTIEAKCTQIIKCKEDNKPFINNIGDFVDETTTVFNKKTITHWKPVLLISRQHIRLFAYIIMQRSEQGNWMIFVSSYAPMEILDKHQATITIRKPKEENLENKVQMEIVERINNLHINKETKDTTFIYTGKILPEGLTKEQVQMTGNYLSVTDEQVKKLCEGRIIFEYAVTIEEIKTE